jgi:hypothetical protein
MGQSAFLSGTLYDYGIFGFIILIIFIVFVNYPSADETERREKEEWKPTPDRTKSEQIKFEQEAKEHELELDLKIQPEEELEGSDMCVGDVIFDSYYIGREHLAVEEEEDEEVDQEALEASECILEWDTICGSYKTKEYKEDEDDEEEEEDEELVVQDEDEGCVFLSEAEDQVNYLINEQEQEDLERQQQAENNLLELQQQAENNLVELAIHEQELEIQQMNYLEPEKEFVMALQSCYECNKEISTKAILCPQCGAPQNPVSGLADKVKEKGGFLLNAFRNFKEDRERDKSKIEYRKEHPEQYSDFDDLFENKDKKSESYWREQELKEFPEGYASKLIEEFRIKKKQQDYETHGAKNETKEEYYARRKEYYAKMKKKYR